MKVDWQVGDFVVCVGNFKGANKLYSEFEHVVLGKVYQIRDIAVIDDSVGIHVEEIVNPCVNWADGYYELYFDHVAFRKLHKSRLDIFTKTLKKVPENA